MSSLDVEKMERSCEDVSRILRLLAHPARLRLLGYLTDGAKSVTELQGLCEISQSQLSQFLIRLRSEGLLKAERDGAYQLYSIEDQRVLKLLKTLEALFCK